MVENKPENPVTLGSLPPEKAKTIIDSYELPEVLKRDLSFIDLAPQYIYPSPKTPLSSGEGLGGGSPKTTDWIETYTNKKFYPLEPDMELICIEDIAHALAHICRFNGHTKRFYSVGEHSLSCLGLARRMGLSYSDRLAALMHDASEAYLADIPRPIKRGMHAYSAWEHTLQKMICEKWGIQYPFSDAIHKIDNIMLATERRDLFISPNHWPSLTEDPSYDINVESGYNMDPATVKQSFIEEFYNLRKVLGKP